MVVFAFYQEGVAVTSDLSDLSSIDQPVGRKAIVVGVFLSTDDLQMGEDDLDELQSLLSTLGVQCVGRVVQKRQRLVAKSLIGAGKADEIALMAVEKEADLVVFDHSLSPLQVRNLEKMTGCRVIDRSGVILDIFVRHAHTNQAKVQVEIARLEYLLPRLTGAWTHFQRQKGGGVRARGMGEKQIEIDRRRARERISKLQKQLENIQKDHMTQRKARIDELKVSLVGYTNSGKTTVMNSLTKANLQAEDVLFATLDSNIRTIDPTTRPKLLLSDTVGFIRKLPHSLIESFKTTLDEVLEADLLLHVVDVSHSNYRVQVETTEQVLREIGADNIPVMMVFNKIDRLDDPHLPKILMQGYKNSICISALDMADTVRLRDHVFKFFEKTLRKVTLRVPPQYTAAMSLIYRTCIILSSDFSEEHIALFDVQATDQVLSKLKPFILKENDTDEKTSIKNI
jgi:GTPase